MCTIESGEFQQDQNDDEFRSESGLQILVHRNGI